MPESSEVAVPTGAEVELLKLLQARLDNLQSYTRALEMTCRQRIGLLETKVAMLTNRKAAEADVGTKVVKALLDPASPQ